MKRGLIFGIIIGLILIGSLGSVFGQASPKVVRAETGETIYTFDEYIGSGTPDFWKVPYDGKIIAMNSIGVDDPDSYIAIQTIDGLKNFIGINDVSGEGDLPAGNDLRNFKFPQSCTIWYGIFTICYSMSQGCVWERTEDNIGNSFNFGYGAYEGCKNYSGGYEVKAGDLIHVGQAGVRPLVNYAPYIEYQTDSIDLCESTTCEILRKNNLYFNEIQGDYYVQKAACANKGIGWSLGNIESSEEYYLYKELAEINGKSPFINNTCLELKNQNWATLEFFWTDNAAYNCNVDNVVLYKERDYKFDDVRAGESSYYGICEFDTSLLEECEICDDGIDNDCDGEIDENCGQTFACGDGKTQSCSTGLLGVCSEGTQTCSDGIWGACVQNTQPSEEICDNGLDDDCDGETDEGCVIESCGNGIINSGEDCDLGTSEDWGNCYPPTTPNEELRCQCSLGYIADADTNGCVRLETPISFWADLNENPLLEININFDGASVLMKYLKGGISPSEELLFKIFDNNNEGVKDITLTSKSITDANNVQAQWNINIEEVIDKEGPFYFKVNGVTSNDLNINILSECSGINFCSDYFNETSCELDLCGVSDVSVEYVKDITCGQEVGGIRYDCLCEWNSTGGNNGQGQCGPRDRQINVTSTTSLEIDQGYCFYVENVEDNCEDDFLSYDFVGTWNWGEALPTGHGLDSNFYSEEDLDGDGSNEAYYNPVANPATGLRESELCESTVGDQTVPCPAQLKLPFFGFWNLVLSLSGILLISLIWLRREDL
jgi:hypothetical protein